MANDINWDCPDCGRHMTPHGDCVHCYKIERARQEADGEIKRAKNIVVGDIISPRFSFKIQSIEVHTVEHTSKGKVIINKGRGFHMEEIFQGEQWVDVVQSPVETTPLVESETPLDLTQNCATVSGMKTMNEHNAETYQRFAEARKAAYKTGVLCPACAPKDVELLKDDPTVLLSSYPPQVAVHCPQCGYRNTILA